MDKHDRKEEQICWIDVRASDHMLTGEESITN